jgi:hypothetical protein
MISVAIHLRRRGFCFLYDAANQRLGLICLGVVVHVPIGLVDAVEEEPAGGCRGCTTHLTRFYL